jgi:DNA-binding CsgD family transcriptional regulator
MIGIGPDDEDDADDEAQYWAVAPCPISDYRARTGDLSAVRMSDLISQRRYHELPIFREYFHPAGLNHVIDLGLPAAPARHRSFIFFRRDGAGDFSERDRAILDLLRPHFRNLEVRAALRRRLMDSAGPLGTDGNSGAYTELTPREREIVWLVAEGKTNAQIAVELWVAPSTVKKHLEHVYEKLGVGRRTAAATLARAIH